MIDKMTFNKFNPITVTVDGTEYGATYSLDRAARTVTVHWYTEGGELRHDTIPADHPAYLEARHTCMAFYREIGEKAPERIKQERAKAVADDRRPWINTTINGKRWEIYFSGTEHRTIIKFTRKPAGKVLEALKAEGFKWSPNRCAWVAKLDQQHYDAAQRLQWVMGA